MAFTYIYRTNGGFVKGMSISADAYATIDTDLFAIVTDPPAPDGDDLVPQKIFDAGTIRNATPAEITGFDTKLAEDETLEHRRAAKAQLDGQPTFRKINRALITVINDELNLLRAKVAIPDKTPREMLDAVKAEISSGRHD